jgi:hypothetical protein
MTFIRQVRRKAYIQEEIIQPGVFECGSSDSLSFHLVPEDQSIEDFTRQYLNHPWSKNGDLVGVVSVQDTDFSAVGWSIPIRDDHGDSDDPFSSFHYVATCMDDNVQIRVDLAQLARVESHFKKRGYEAYKESIG